MPADPDNFLLEPVPNDEAVAWLKDKPVVSRKVFDAIVPELRGRAFLITGIEDANVAAEVRDIIAGLPAGESWESSKAQLVDKLGPWLSSDDPDQKSAKARAELLLRTHGFQAYQVAQHRVMREQQDVFPYWQYLSLDDEKVRPAHAALNEKIAPADSPFWLDHSPPWQWGCRCRKVPLLQEEADEYQAEDASKPPERQRVLQGPALKLAEQGRMYDPQGRQLSIASDRQKGNTNGFVFDPDALTLPISQLKDRYDPTTWAEFEQSMQTAQLDDGRTVWSWLHGAKATGKRPARKAAPLPASPPAAAPPVTPVAPAKPAAPAAATSGTTPTGTPLVGKLDAAKLTKSEKARVSNTLALIDQVHGDGPLEDLPVGHRPGRGSLGAFTHYRGGKAARIDYLKTSKRANLHRELTLAHEIGHWIDHTGAPGDGMTSEIAGGAFAAVIKAAKDTDAVKAITAMDPSSMRSYYLRPREIFARAYAQFISEETGDSVLVEQVAKIRKENVPERQWESPDFQPVRSEMRKAFVKLGWMQEVAP